MPLTTVEHIGSAHVLPPGPNELDQGQRSELGRLDHEAAPATSAGIASPIERISGKFQGLMMPTTG